MPAVPSCHVAAGRSELSCRAGGELSGAGGELTGAGGAHPARPTRQLAPFSSRSIRASRPPLVND